jgi:glycosyltransferase involved in cell wall biosynthesis
LLKAYASLSHKLRRDYLLVIAGPQGWGGLDVRTEAVRLGIFESIKVTGYVSEDVLSTLYYHAEFLAFPSLYEGFGLPIVEAMAAGTPVLTSNVSSMPEVAGDAALLVDPFDEESIADGLKTLLTLESEALRLASRARANAARFSWQIAARELHDVLAEAVRVRRGDA